MSEFNKRLSAGVGPVALITGMGSIPAAAGDLPYERLAGPSRVETLLAIARYTWGDTWKVVYVASSRSPVDALLATTIDDGPVVFIDGNILNLGGVKPSKMAILGGLGAVPQAIADQAKVTGVEAVRLAGVDRDATVAEIAKRWVVVNSVPKNVYVAKNVGSGSSDAVTALVLRDGPTMIFTNDASVAVLVGIVPDLKAEKVTILGGTGVVPDAAVEAVANGKVTAHLAGLNRCETTFETAKYAKAQKSGSNVYLASDTALKDAMVVGATKDGVILLPPANGEGAKSKADVLSVAKLIVIGGTGVTPDSAVTAAATGVIPQPAQTVQPTWSAQPTQPAQPKLRQPEPRKPARQPKQSTKHTPTKSA